jgi:nitrogen-specific signal transduction histidine kinase
MDRDLGLTMVYDAVHAHQGLIEVSSEPLVGTCVDAYLPARQNMPPGVKAPPVFKGAQKLQL